MSIIRESRVSVIVPVYDVEKYLDQCVKSIVNQTYQNLEIILVDDGSTDSCPEMCDNWSMKDSRIRVIHQKNQGLSVARNTGLMEAVGEWILFVDSDDIVSESLIEYATDALRKTDADIVTYGFLRSKHPHDVMIKQHYSVDMKATTIMSGRHAMLSVLRDQEPSFCWRYLARHSLYEKNNVLFPAGRIMEDMAITYHLFGCATLVADLPIILYFYRNRPGSILTSPKLESITQADWANIHEREARTSRMDDETRLASLKLSINVLFGVHANLHNFSNNLRTVELRRMLEETDDGIRERVSKVGFHQLNSHQQVKYVLFCLHLLPLYIRFRQHM